MSLLGRFSAMGVVVVAALGLAIGEVLKHQIEHRAKERAVNNAQVIAQVGLQMDIDDEALALRPLLGIRPVVGVEAQAFEENLVERR